MSTRFRTPFTDRPTEEHRFVLGRYHEPGLPSRALLRGLQGSVDDILWAGGRSQSLTPALERALQDVYLDLECWSSTPGLSRAMIPTLGRHIRWLLGWTERVDRLLWSQPSKVGHHDARETLDAVMDCAAPTIACGVHVVHFDEVAFYGPLNRLCMLFATALQSALWHSDDSPVLATVARHDDGVRIRVYDEGRLEAGEPGSDRQRRWSDPRDLDHAFMRQVAFDLGGTVELSLDEDTCVTDIQLPASPHALAPWDGEGAGGSLPGTRARG